MNAIINKFGRDVDKLMWTDSCLPLRPKKNWIDVIDIRKIDINSVVSAGLQPGAGAN